MAKKEDSGQVFVCVNISIYDEFSERENEIFLIGCNVCMEKNTKGSLWSWGLSVGIYCAVLTS